MVAGPMPSIWSSWSTDEMPPCWSRKSTMFWAVTGPIPSIVSSSSTVAVPRLIGPSLASAAPPRPPATAAPPAASAGHDDLLTVGEPRGEVDPLDLGPRGGAAGALHGVVDARSGRQPVDARLPHRAGDVDDHVLAALRVDAERAAGRAGGVGRPTEKLTPPAAEPGWSAERIQRAPTSSRVTATAP